jgi:FLVCR family feline leukemia virus subgroup C receptor-related protein
MQRSSNAPLAVDEEQTLDYQLQISYKRWITLGLYSILAVSNTWMWIAFSTISQLVQFKFEISEVQVDFLSTIYFIVYIPFLFIGPLIVSSKSLKSSIFYGSVLNAIGGLVRYIACLLNSYGWLIAGQTIAGISQPFWYSLPAQVAAEWFPSNERGFATGFGIFSVYLGTGLGLLCGPLVLRDYENFDDYFMVQSAVAMVISIAIRLFQEDSPTLPPSYTAPQIRYSQPIDQPSLFSWSSVKLNLFMMRHLLRNRSFLLLVIAFGINVGAFDAVCTLADSIVEFESAITMGWVYFVFVSGGAVGALMFGLFIARYQIFRPLIIAGYATSIVLIASFGAIAAFLDDSILWSIYLVGSLSGFILVGLCTVGLEYGAEITYPAPECASSALLLTSEQIFATIFIESLSLLDLSGSTCLYLLATAEAVGLVLIFFVKEKLGRVMIDQKKIMKQPFISQIPFCESGSRPAEAIPEEAKSANPL